MVYVDHYGKKEKKYINEIVFRDCYLLKYTDQQIQVSKLLILLSKFMKN